MIHHKMLPKLKGVAESRAGISDTTYVNMTLPFGMQYFLCRRVQRMRHSSATS